MCVINVSEMLMCCILATFQYAKSHIEVLKEPRNSFLFGITLTFNNQQWFAKSTVYTNTFATRFQQWNIALKKYKEIQHNKRLRFTVPKVGSPYLQQFKEPGVKHYFCNFSIIMYDHDIFKIIVLCTMFYWLIFISTALVYSIRNKKQHMLLEVGYWNGKITHRFFKTIAFW